MSSAVGEGAPGAGAKTTLSTMPLAVDPGGGAEAEAGALKWVLELELCGGVALKEGVVEGVEISGMASSSSSCPGASLPPPPPPLGWCCGWDWDWIHGAIVARPG